MTTRKLVGFLLGVAVAMAALSGGLTAAQFTDTESVSIQVADHVAVPDDGDETVDDADGTGEDETTTDSDDNTTETVVASRTAGPRLSRSGPAASTVKTVDVRVATDRTVLGEVMGP